MFCRRAIASAATSLAVVVLAVAGCKVQVPSAAQASTGTSDAVQAKTSGVTRAGSLVVEPGAGFSSIYNLINGAKHSIDVTMYEFSDTTAEHDLAAAAKRGVHVHVILDQREQSENSAAYSYFGSHSVKVTWSSPKYRYTHQKTLVVDGSEAVISLAPSPRTSGTASTGRSRTTGLQRYSPALEASVWDVVSAAFGDHDAPSTLLGVTALGWPDQLVEIEAVAVAPDISAGTAYRA